GGGDVHGQVFADFFGAGVLDQHADLAAMHVTGDLVGGLDALEAAHGDVLADFTDQGRTGAFDRAFGKRQLGKGRHVGGILVGDQLGDLRDEIDEVVVLGDE